MKIISNCPLCEEHSLHIIGENEAETQQCISCGYVTSSKLKLNKKTIEENEQWKALTDDMRKWSKVENDRMWLPTMMVLPFGMLHPENIDGEMKWCFSKMVTISEEERKKYPKPKGGFHDRRIDTDNPKIYDLFIEALSDVNKKMKELKNKVKGEKTEPVKTEVKLPKLKRTKK